MPAPLRGEVWMADLDPTRGHEQAGKRPCLVVSADVFNTGPAGLAIALPLTTKAKAIRSHVEVAPPEGGVASRASSSARTSARSPSSGWSGVWGRFRWRPCRRSSSTPRPHGSRRPLVAGRPRIIMGLLRAATFWRGGSTSQLHFGRGNAMIQVRCPHCGKTLKAPDTFAGKTARCQLQSPRFAPCLAATHDCGGFPGRRAAADAPSASPAVRRAARAEPPGGRPQIEPEIEVPAPRSPLPASAEAFLAGIAPSRRCPQRRGQRPRFLYCLLVVTLVPLAWVLLGSEDDPKARFERTIEDHPEVIERLKSERTSGADVLERIVELLPDGKIEGALLAHPGPIGATRRNRTKRRT